MNSTNEKKAVVGEPAARRRKQENIENAILPLAESFVVGCSRLEVSGLSETGRAGDRRDGALTSDILLLPDGRILVHHLTRPMAGLLRKLDPEDKQISQRIRRSRIKHHASRSHELPN